MSNLQIVQLREVRCDIHHRISCHLPLSLSLSLCLSLCLIIDRLQLEALSEIIIIRLNALPATVLQSCFLSITHSLSLSACCPLPLPPSCCLAHLTPLLLMAPSSIYCPLLFGIAHSPLPLAAPTSIQFLVPPLTKLNLASCVVLSLHFNCIINHNYSTHS